MKSGEGNVEIDTRKSVGELATQLTKNKAFKNINIAREYALKLKKQKPLQQGKRCDLCGDYNEEVYPFAFMVCKACVGEMIKNGGNPHIITKKYELKNCDKCLKFVGARYLVNPRGCQKCLQKIARKNRMEWPPRRQG